MNMLVQNCRNCNYPINYPINGNRITRRRKCVNCDYFDYLKKETVVAARLSIEKIGTMYVFLKNE